MHDTAFQIGSKFIANYASQERRVIVEVGALDINGTLRASCPKHCLYLGIDVEHGRGVDIKIDPSQPIPLRAGFSDLTISTSQMEHDPRFWMTFLELCRITRKGGLVYFSAPSNGAFHRYPVDVWRFYPDAGHALAAWARDNNFEITLLESFVAPRQKVDWNDFVAVFYLGTWNPETRIDFLADHFSGYNAWKFGFSTVQNEKVWSEDQELITSNVAERNKLAEEVGTLNARVADLVSEKEKLALALAEAQAKLEQTAPPTL